MHITAWMDLKRIMLTEKKGQPQRFAYWSLGLLSRISPFSLLSPAINLSLLKQTNKEKPNKQQQQQKRLHTV